MANLTNHINLNPSGGEGGDITAGDAIRIDADNEVNVKFDNTSITLNGDGELQATLPIHCIEDYPATVEGEIIINGCGCTAGELYRAGYTGDGYKAGTKYVAPNASYKTNANVSSNVYQKDRTEQIQCYVGTLINNSLQIDSGNSFTSSIKVAADTVVLGDVSIKKVFLEAIEAGSGGLATNEHASLEIPTLLWAVISSNTTSPVQAKNGSSNVWRYNGEFIDGNAQNRMYVDTPGLSSSNYFKNKLLDAIQSIDSDIITIDQFLEKYMLLYHGSHIESGYGFAHNVTYIVLNRTSKEPVMLFSTPTGTSQNPGYANSGYISYSISKQYVTYDMYYAYPDNETILYLSQNPQFVDTGISFNYRPVYHFIYKSNNKIISEGNMYVGSSNQSDALSSLTIDTRLTYPGFSVSRKPAVLDHDIGDIGELGWLPVANCPEPEPEISIEAGDAIRIDDGTEINVKFDGTTITLNDNGELQATGGGSSDCACIPGGCGDEKPTPQEAGEIYVSTCGNDAGVIYRAVEDIYVDTGEPALVLRKKTASSSSAGITTSQSNLQTLFVGTGDYKLFFKASIDGGELTKNFITFASDIEEMQKISPSITSYYHIANKTITRDVSKGATSNVDSNVYYYAPNAPLFPTDQWLQYKQNLYKYDYNYNVGTGFFTVKGNSEYVASVFDVKQSGIPVKVDDSTTRARVLYAMLGCGSATEALEHYNIYRYMVNFSGRYRTGSGNPASMLLIIPKGGTYPVAACLGCSPDYMGGDTRILTRKDFVFDKYVAEDGEVIYVQQDSFADPKQLSSSSYYSSHNEPSRLMIKVDSSNNITAMCAVNTNETTSSTYPNVYHSYTYLIAGYTAASMSITGSLRREPVSTQKVNDLQVELDYTKSNIESLQQAIADLNTRVTALENA